MAPLASGYQRIVVGDFYQVDQAGIENINRHGFQYWNTMFSVSGLLNR